MIGFSRNCVAFAAGFSKGWRHAFINHYSDKYLAFWYECGYGLSFAISGWYSSYCDDYAALKKGNLNND